MKPLIRIAILLLTTCFFAREAAASEVGITVSAVSTDGVVQKAAEALRYYLSIPGRKALPCGKVVIGVEDDFSCQSLNELGQTGPDGYKICKDGNDIIIAGNNARGALYGVGALIRMEEFHPVCSTPENDFRVSCFSGNTRFADQRDPQAIRIFDGQVRDVALFGANGIQLLRNAPSEWIDVVHSWGLDVWIVTWDNESPSEFRSPSGIRQLLNTRKSRVDSYPWLDHYIVKSGDPGDLDIDTFFSFTSMEAKVVRNRFPEARIWVCPQHYKDAPAEYFEKACSLASESDWLYGVMAGCWTRFPAEKMRSLLPERLRMIQGPDVTHIYSDMYPARDMDLPLARSLGRICIHIAPETQKHNHNLADRFCDGSQIYSEGTTDDIHKCLWAALDWNPSADAAELVREYARVFLPGLDDAEFAKGVMAVERNAIGPLEKSDGMLDNLALWQKLESSAGPETLDNPRFLMPLLRAHFDAYIYKRWVRDLPIETACYDLMASAQGNPAKTMNKVRKLLSGTEPCVDKDLRKKCESLYSRLYRDKGRWMIQNQENFFMSQMDLPLIDSGYINEELDRIRSMGGGKKEILAAVRSLGERFRSTKERIYFNLGDFSTESVTGISSGWDADPAFLTHPVRNFGCAARRFAIDGMKMSGGYAPRAWLVQAGMWYDQPMVLSFGGLEPGCYYTVRVTYAGEPAKIPSHVKLTQGGKLVHRPLLFSREIEGEWNLPLPASEDGSVTLEWKANYGERGVCVAEVALIKRSL